MFVIEANKYKTNEIGRLGENNARVMKFDISETLAEFPEASFSLINQRHGDPAGYPVNHACVVIEGNYLYWAIMNSDLAMEGSGKCEIIATVDDVVVKDDIYSTSVGKALDGSGEPPEPWESWVEEVTEAVEHYPKIENDYWYVWDVANGEWVNTGVNARGTSAIDDTATASSRDKTWSAHKISQELETKADKADTVLDTTLSRGRRANSTVGTASMAFGSIVTASGTAARAGGYNTYALGHYSEATGYCSRATHRSQRVFGEYNIDDPSENAVSEKGTYAEIVGNGTATAYVTTRSNARTLDWSGNERLKGTLYVNCNADSSGGNAVATLDSNGKVPSSQLPSYVDDVQEYSSLSAFPLTGESGIIYIALDTNKTYRWSGSVYVEIGGPIAVATTTETQAIIDEYGVSA